MLSSAAQDRKRWRARRVRILRRTGPTLANAGANAVSSLASASSEKRHRSPCRPAIPGGEVSRMGFQSQELSAGLVARYIRNRACDKGIGELGDRRCHRRAAPAGAGSEWACTAGHRPAAGRRHRHRCGGGRGTRRTAGGDRWPTRPYTWIACDGDATCQFLLLLDILGFDRGGRHAGPNRARATGAPRSPTSPSHCTDLGDRVALYAYYSQGRSAVSMVPVKRFDHHLDSHVIRRFEQPGTWRILAPSARRFGTVRAVLEARGGTSRRLLGGAVRRAGLRPRLRAGLRRGRCAPCVERSASPRHRLRLPDGGGGHRRRIAAQSIRKHGATPASLVPISSRVLLGHCSVRRFARPRCGGESRGRTAARAAFLKTNICSTYAPFTATQRTAEG